MASSISSSSSSLPRTVSGFFGASGSNQTATVLPMHKVDERIAILKKESVKLKARLEEMAPSLLVVHEKQSKVSARYKKVKKIHKELQKKEKSAQEALIVLDNAVEAVNGRWTEALANINLEGERLSQTKLLCGLEFDEVTPLINGMPRELVIDQSDHSIVVAYELNVAAKNRMAAHYEPKLAEARIRHSICDARLTEIKENIKNNRRLGQDLINLKNKFKTATSDICRILGIPLSDVSSISKRLEEYLELRSLLSNQTT